MDIENLKERISKANISYRKGVPEIGDSEYDNLVDEFQKNVSKEEYDKFRNSLNEGAIENGNKVKHAFVAGSLDKLKYEEPKTIRNFLKKNVHGELNVSAKIDGLSGIAHYVNGKIVGFATRGDGYFGIDIFNKARFIKFLPDKIDLKDDVYIRGELVILKEDFPKVVGTSPRNVVAGLINRKDFFESDLRNVSFIAYTVMGERYTKKDQFKILSDNGFKLPWNICLDNSTLSDPDIVEKLFGYATQDFEYDTDGLVISDSDYRNEDAYRPKNQVAFKTNQQTFETRLINIEWQGPSKNGRFNILGLLDPVEVCGVLVSKCTLHNLDFVKEKNVKIGDIVRITRSGDVIPKFIDVVKTTPESVDITLPETCSCCGSELVKDGPFLFCKNENCIDRTTNQVVDFIKRLGVEFASFKTLQNLGIHTIQDLVNFKANKKYKTEIKLEQELYNKVFTRSKRDIFCALNMKDLAEISLNSIVDFFGWNVIERREVEIFDLTMFPSGIGEISMAKFIDSYKKNLELVNIIVSDERYHYVEIEDNTFKKDKTILGSICFTGSLNKMTRTEASKLAESNGYVVKSGVSKGLTYLVQADKNSVSSKTKKAISLGTKILGEEEFLKLMNGDSMNVDDL